MAESLYRRSATIYPFPAKPLRRMENRRDEKADLDVQDICAAAIDGCWYHEEAVRAETKDRPGIPGKLN
ncbi:MULTISPECIES: DUF2735 domain-containing protein [unclassified Sinorhizobium]|uniref:DUF2735 domain-containing protein n=1 Tax=unclassified Sinorhizobium TaxID=2613772 RepID=UPI0024C3D9E3|nr:MULTISPECIES: DUF2735 domain-containing protein [unclassified Sinorhizobium]MDK1374450.1 DUF2735 domain-containing protein [Sinorhizobium sp. 6-70]MDK1482522.1 DUF2735 domain-containing protein [Sinorhizobium sp. 6-117]